MGVARTFTLSVPTSISLSMLHQVVIPSGVGRRAALRGGDHVTVAVAVVDERRGPDLSALRPPCREQEELVTEGADALAGLRVELVDDPLVPVGHAY